MKENMKPKPSDSISISLIVFIFSCVLILWVLTLIIISVLFDTPQDRGLFGDMFGSVNALFSGLAFAGVIVALILQKKELSLQRAELEQTREELKGQKEQLQLQNINLSKQNFENTFFNLLKLHHEYISHIEVPGFGANKGRNVLEEFIRKYNNILKSNTHVQSQTDKKDKILEANRVFKRDYPGHLDIYFRNILNALSFIEKSEIEEKRFYGDLLKAQFSIFELQLINYFSIDTSIDKDFGKLIKEYKILQDLTEQDRIL